LRKTGVKVPVLNIDTGIMAASPLYHCQATMMGTSTPVTTRHYMLILIHSPSHVQTALTAITLADPQPWIGPHTVARVKQVTAPRTKRVPSQSMSTRRWKPFLVSLGLIPLAFELLTRNITATKAIPPKGRLI
jgi:hypothetical protein